MEAVKISNLSYKYPSADEYCLKNVSFSVSEGEVCAIVGPNGCGKTTICNIIRGLIPSFHGGEVEGSVEIFGKSTKEISEEEKAKRIGFVFQNPFTQNSGIKETVFEEIAFGLENMGVDREEIITKVMDIISLLQIEAFMFKHPCELSGGQRQRVALASIIVQDPDIIVIDEPTSQLDPKGTEDVFEIIKYLNRQKKTIVLVEHKMNLIAEYADHIYISMTARCCLTDLRRTYCQAKSFMKKILICPMLPFSDFRQEAEDFLSTKSRQRWMKL